MMEPFELNALAFQEPWRLWTGHLAHFGARHALLNLAALGVPWLLADRQGRRRLALALLLAAPLLGLGILGQIEDGTYRGASGLACLAWAMTGAALAAQPGSRTPGLLMLGTLTLKIAAECTFGAAFSRPGLGWEPLPAAHAMGAGLGLLGWAAFRHLDGLPGPEAGAAHP